MNTTFQAQTPALNKDSATWSGESPSGNRPIFNREFFTACLWAFVVSTLLSLPMMLRGLPSGHDSYVHYRWAVEFKAALAETGVFYPRWLAAANHHQGSPVMLFYPPLVCFVTTAFSFLAKDMLQALALSCWLGLFLSGIAMYIFCRPHFSGRVSLLAALFYLAAPYHLFDLYHRAALSELWSFVWVPLIFDAVYRISRATTWQATLYLALSYALLLFTHLPVAFAVTLVLPVQVLFLTRKWHALFGVAAGLIWGFGLSAIFTIPVWFERDYVKFDRLLAIKYNNNFLFENLTKTPLLRLTEQGEVDTLKLADWIAVSLLLIFLSAVVVELFKGAQQEPAKQSSRSLPAFLTLSAITLLLTMRISTPIWKAIPHLAYLQFPFRWLTVASVCIGYLAGRAITSLIANTKIRAPHLAALLAVAFTLTISTVVLLKSSYDREAILKGPGLIEVKEYFPVWWEQSKRLEKQDAVEALPAVAVAGGTAGVMVNDDTGIQQAYVAQATSDAVLVFRTLYFPGWVAYVDGQRRAVEPNEKGNIRLAVEAGEHAVTLKFEDTWPRRLGKTVSGFALLLILMAQFLSKGLAARKRTFLTPAASENNNETR